MTNTVFIHTNKKQIVGAIVSQHSLKRQSSNQEAFDVKILLKEDYTFFKEFEGRKFLRSGGQRTWKNDDLQSFTPTRFMPPELMGYQGHAVVIDPDIFAIGDINELFNRDTKGAAIMARGRPGHNSRKNYIASSVMLLDCTNLKHWKVKEQFASMFENKLDYENWITLALEPEGSIGFLEDEWNDFDNLTAKTKLLHNTKRKTQPWKAGLPIDYTTRIPFLSKFLPDNGFRLWGRYQKHPDPRQEELFFAFVKECLSNGSMSEAMLRDEMRKNHVRHDALELVKRVRGVDSILDEARNSIANAA
jgi:hypothetical protein